MSEPRKRREVPLEDTWSVERIYADNPAWEADFASTDGFASDFSERAGTIADGPDALLGAVEEMLRQQRFVEKLYVYASMRQDEDLTDPVHGGMFSRIQARATEIASAQSFFAPELLSIPEGIVDSWLALPAFEQYRPWLDEILRYRPHTLTEPEEKLLAMSREVSRGFYTAYGKLSDVDLPARLPAVDDRRGGRTRITNANMTSLLTSPDDGFRQDVFRGYYTELSGSASTAAALLDGQARSNIFYSRARRHGSALEASLFGDGVDRSVYESLIEAVHAHLPAMHRYYAFKKRSLGLSEMHFRDIYLSSIEAVDRRYGFDEAVELVLEAVGPLGGEYVELLAGGFADRWVDRYENTGKRSGAYSGGSYDTLPYILHNFSGTLDSVFTLAHEAGHSLHSLLSRRKQPYQTSEYRILLAEVASTTNEALLLDLMLGRASSDAEKAYLLDHLVNDFRTTVFRQTMFAEFEWRINSEVESGGALTPEFLSSTYMDLVKLYHGSAFEYGGDDAMIACEWARIPHFYYNFYVYKYATGLCSAVDISRRILDGEQGAVDRYLGFLAAGSSRPPLELLAAAGVDLTTPAPVGNALKHMEKSIEMLEGIRG